MNTKLNSLILALVVAMFSFQCSAPDEEPKQRQSMEPSFRYATYAFNGVTLPYREGVSSLSNGGGNSLIVVLHGQYSNGTDNKAHLAEEPMAAIWYYLTDNDINAVMIAPQCPTNRSWYEKKSGTNDVVMSECLKALIDNYILKHTEIDPSRIYLIGYTEASDAAGTGGVWRMLSNYPNTFAAAVGVAAEPDDTISVKSVAKTPVLFVRGYADVHATSNMLDTFGDWVRDEGGTFREDILQIGSRSDLCLEAFTKERMDWVLQFTKQ